MPMAPRHPVSTESPSPTRRKLEDVIRALVALTHTVPDIQGVDVMAWTSTSDCVRLSVKTDDSLVSLSALLDARIETYDLGSREWEAGLCQVGAIRVEISGPHRDKRAIPEPKPVVLDGADAALAAAEQAARP